jgi:hypothetical protein
VALRHDPRPHLPREFARVARFVAEALAAALVVGLFSAIVVAVDLQDRTKKAYDAYLETARTSFVAGALLDRSAPPRPGVVTVSPGRDGGIMDVPGGLIHHWVGATFVRGATLQQALDVSRDYDDYAKVYKTVVASRLIARDGETYHVWMRLKGRGGGVTAVLDVRSTIVYVRRTARSVYSISTLDEIREIRNPGMREELLLPAGRDSGYLWRGNTFTRLSERDGGLLTEMETIGLSRRFPPLLGPIIGPIARAIGRRSVETSLQEFATALGPTG